ncbi:uncharacterized protein TRIVIDRAFT_149124 [Trichoderma virens Gv29-8]|uniref:Zn(2)-C6 fungal-type domain-containing protein n=1 Tax=Hypocrea virens (strain Gv29-8 / FGSC 10586) TaxID=413071 RepID=G9MN73_HYPVG|nr:uncharacterized protein TRIVIDRAFT_149124 [Trichoderma virens Gv29-8]EHK24165.1 hypothetical protein TRIVIDRAFT_149124 [Trichoderma virens Gv29-8]
MATITPKTRNTRTACDRCYELKERCARSAISLACTRCNRLQLSCSITRPIRPVGRRPNNWNASVGAAASNPIISSTNKQRQVDVGFWFHDGINIDFREREQLRFLLNEPQNFGYHLVSRSFELTEHRSLVAFLPAAMPLLKDAFLSYASGLQFVQTGVAVDVDVNASHRYASSAIEVLRSLNVTNIQEAILCLTLGKVLVLSVYSLIGVGAAEICQYCLNTAMVYTNATISWDQDVVSQHSFLMFMETIDCLVHCRKPTQRFPPQQAAIMDRYLGLCLSLLPYYYDLCVINHSMVNNTDTSYLVYLYKKLDEVRVAVDAWRPPPLGDLMHHVETVDMINLLAQAKVYRLAALLVIHRLRYPFGQQDGQANVWANEIMKEFELADWATKQATRCVTMPYIVAAVEIQDFSLRVRALENVTKYVDKFTPTVQRSARQFLSRIWLERDNNITYCWFQSVTKPCPVLQSLEC